MTKLTTTEACKFDVDDAFSEEEFDAMLEEQPQTVKPLLLLLQGDTGDGKTYTALHTLHEEMKPCLFLHSYKEDHGFTMPKGVTSFCFEAQKDDEGDLIQIKDPETAYNRLLAFLYSKGIRKFKSIVFDSYELDHLIWEHSLVKGAGKFGEGRTAKQLYWEVTTALKAVHAMGIHVICTFGVTITQPEGEGEERIPLKAKPYIMGKPATAVPQWFGDRLMLRMTETTRGEETVSKPLWATRTLVEKERNAIIKMEKIKKDNGKDGVSPVTVNVRDTVKCRLRNLDIKKLDGREAKISEVWEFIKRKSDK